MSRKFLFAGVVTVIGVLGFAPGCDSSVSPTGSSGNQTGNADVMVIHASPDGPAVYLYVDGTKVASNVHSPAHLPAGPIASGSSTAATSWGWPVKPGSGLRIIAHPEGILELLGASLEAEVQRALSAESSRATVVSTGEAGVGIPSSAACMHDAGPNSDRPVASINIATSGDRHQRLSLVGSDFSSLTSSRRSLLEHPTTVVIKHIDCRPITRSRKVSPTVS